MTVKHIVAGSGGFQYREGQVHFGPLVHYALALSHKKRPDIAYLATATGDNPERIAAFYDAASRENVNASHLELFPMPNHNNIREYLLSQDVIWVSGGSLVNLLAVWEAHGIGAILRESWEAGIVLAGQSAGSICWYSGGMTDSYGKPLQHVTTSLALLPYSNNVHYDTEEDRRPLFQKLIREGKLAEGYAVDDGVNLHFIDTNLARALSDTPGKRAYHVYLNDTKKLTEDIIEPELLS